MLLSELLQPNTAGYQISDNNAPPNSHETQNGHETANSHETTNSHETVSSYAPLNGHAAAKSSAITRAEAAQSSAITRAEAAKRIHEYLLKELKEADEPDISPATYLKDLYDCNVCAGHIAQVYLKGIMLPVKDRAFGGKSLLTDSEAVDILKRIVDKSTRIIPDHVFEEKKNGIRVQRILLSDIYTLDSPRIIDVRPKRDFDNDDCHAMVTALENDNHPAMGNIIENIPLSSFVLNPQVISNDKYINTVFVCEEGESALLAANCAAKAGYRRIYFSAYRDIEKGICNE